jgi:single-strand DNA-binding protein
MNKVILIGNLTRDPDYGETQSGISFCNFSIAVNRPYADSNGERQTDFFNIKTWRGQADNCAKYLRKGSKVGVVGSLQTRTYEDNDGNKRNVTEIVANEVEFLSSANKSDDSGETTRAQRSRPELEPIDDGDLPF